MSLYLTPINTKLSDGQSLIVFVCYRFQPLVGGTFLNVLVIGQVLHPRILCGTVPMFHSFGDCNHNAWLQLDGFFAPFLVAGGDMGKQLYLDSINYTGYYSRIDSTAVPGAYTVVFHRNDGREDVTTNARYGFKEVTAAKLCNVEVLSIRMLTMTPTLSVTSAAITFR